MESFGLFQLLNSLLPKPPQTEDQTEGNPPPPPQNDQHEKLPTTDKPNACVDFFERHNQRAQKRR